MRILMMTVLLVCSCTSLALAQDDYHRVEVFAGYSHNSVDKIAGSELFSTSTFDPSRFGLHLSRAKGRAYTASILRSHIIFRDMLERSFTSPVITEQRVTKAMPRLVNSLGHLFRVLLFSNLLSVLGVVL
jgi:hypothetical protein